MDLASWGDGDTGRTEKCEGVAEEGKPWRLERQ